MTPADEDYLERLAICLEGGDVSMERARLIAIEQHLDGLDDDVIAEVAAALRRKRAQAAQAKRPLPARGGAQKAPASTGRGVDGLDDKRASTGLEGAR